MEEILAIAARLFLEGVEYQITIGQGTINIEIR